MYVGPWASSEEAWWTENRSIVKKEQDQELHEQTMAVKARRGGPRRVISSANRRCQKMSPIIQGYFPRRSTDKDTPYERAEGRRAKKYLGESYCHRIKCSAANSRAAFIWRRPLNSAALVAPTHRELKEVSDGTSTQAKS